jgi:hypothetical protein
MCKKNYWKTSQTLISYEENSKLIKPIQEEEVYGSLRQMNPDKAPDQMVSLLTSTSFLEHH